MVKTKKVLLYSGGMDSWLISKLWKPDIKLYVDMNTKYSKDEISRLPDDVIVEKLDLSKWERDDKIIPLRNLYLVMLATNYGDTICLGATAGDRVLDKSYTFATKASGLLSYLYSPQHWTEGKQIEIDLAYKDKSKRELLNLYVEQGGDLLQAWNKSFSCYNPQAGSPCFACKPCFRKAVAFYQCMQDNNINPNSIFSTASKKILYQYIDKNIIQDAVNGKTGRGKKEENDIISFYQYLRKEVD